MPLVPSQGFLRRYYISLIVGRLSSGRKNIRASAMQSYLKIACQTRLMLNNVDWGGGLVGGVLALRCGGAPSLGRP